MKPAKIKPLTEGQRNARKRRGGQASRKKQGGTGLQFVTPRYARRAIITATNAATSPCRSGRHP